MVDRLNDGPRQVLLADLLFPVVDRPVDEDVGFELALPLLELDVVDLLAVFLLFGPLVDLGPGDVLADRLPMINPFGSLVETLL